MSNVEHFSLGNITATVGLTKSNLMTAAKLGAGATIAITLGDLIQSRLLVQNGAPIIPTKWAPLVHAAFGIMGGALVGKKFSAAVGTGMAAGGVGLALSSVIGQVMSGSMAASSAAATVAENAGSAPQAVAGFGLGRAFAPSMRSLAGLSRTVKDPSLLFGVGTPDMSAAGMFNGATVAIEQGGRGLRGATVGIEQSAGRFASAFS